MKTILTKREKELELRKELLILSTLEIKPNYSALSRKYNIDRRTVKKYNQGYDGKSCLYQEPQFQEHINFLKIKKILELIQIFIDMLNVEI